MTDLDKAREWSNGALNDGPFPPHEGVAARLIQSLPDHWVDAEKVLELADQLAEEAGDFASEGLAHRYMVIAKRLRDAVTVSLPTLADMTPEEREACQWMQAQTWHEVGIIVWVDEIAEIITKNNGAIHRKLKDVTPLPDLPKLEWPGSEVVEPPALPEDERIESWHEIATHKFFSDCYRDGVLIDHMIKKLDEVVDAEIVDEPEDTCSGSIHTPMQPSEVPPNEPWLIEVDGQKAIGTRYKRDAIIPWAIAALNGLFTDHSNDSEVTLIHKLVPEQAALPEGMRLADHVEYGRVIVSPKVDTDEDHKVFYSNDSVEEVTGAGWGFAHKSELTLLDGADV